MDVSVQSERNQEIFISESTLNIANDILENLLLNVEDLLHHIENREESPLFKPATNEDENLLVREIEEIELEEIYGFSDMIEDEPEIDLEEIDENAYSDTIEDKPEIDLEEIDENPYSDTIEDEPEIDLEEIDENAYSDMTEYEPEIDLEEIDENSYSDMLEDEPAIDSATSGSIGILTSRRLIPFRCNLLPDINEVDVESDNVDSLDLNSLLDSDSDDEVASYDFARPEPSEDIGDRDEFDDMEGMEFVQFYLRDAILRRGYNHGSGDYVAGGSDDEDEEDDEIDML